MLALNYLLAFMSQEIFYETKQNILQISGPEYLQHLPKSEQINKTDSTLQRVSVNPEGKSRLYHLVQCWPFGGYMVVIRDFSFLKGLRLCDQREKQVPWDALNPIYYLSRCETLQAAQNHTPQKQLQPGNRKEKQGKYDKLGSML